jgi:tetratricopeptide (TPR) repeat protein
LVHAAPDSARLHQVAGELLDSEGNFPRAIDQYHEALEKDPELTGIHRALGVAMLNASQDDASMLRAQKEFKLELAIDPDDAHSEYELGEIYWRKHQPEEALKHYSRAVQLRRNFTDALLALGKVWVFQGQADQALQVLQEAVKIDPNNEVAHYRLAQAYRKLGQAAESELELAQFRRLREASASLGMIYQQVQRKPITEQTIESGQ